MKYFDAHLIGLTATPSKQTFGFFHQNLVMEYSRRRAVADGINVDGRVYQIRTVIRAFRDRLFTEIFPGREDVPKTLIFAKDDSHAEEIVRILREEFGSGNESCKKITYRSEADLEILISDFRISYNPRIAVTVEMIATVTDVKPIEILLFMRLVKSRNYFEL